MKEKFAFVPPPGNSKEARREVLTHLLETCAENNKEIHVLENALRARSLSTLAKLYDRVAKQYKPALGALLFAYASHAAAGEDLQVTSTTLEQVENTQEWNGPKPPEIESIYRAAYEVDLPIRVLVQTDSPNAPTIVHIGQTHVVEKHEKHIDNASRDSIYHSQRNVYSFLLEATDSDTAVFLEGFIPNDQLEMIRENSRELESIDDEVELLQKYLEICQEYPTYNELAAYNKIVSNKLLSWGYVEELPLQYQKDGFQFNLLSNDNAILMHQPDYASMLVGGAETLHAKGFIKALPAETTDGNGLSSVLRENLEDKSDRLREIFDSLDAEETYRAVIGDSPLTEHDSNYITQLAESDACKIKVECQDIINEILTVDIPAIKNAVFLNRETIAVKIIAEYSETSGQMIYPVVYGHNHDFTQAVINWNETHPDRQFNLIEVRSEEVSEE